MRVLHVFRSVDPLRGGSSRAVLDMTRGLAQAGLEVHLATTDDNGAGRLDVPLGQPVVQDGVTTWYFPRQMRFYAASWPLAQWLARRVLDYDFVHVHGLFSYPPPLACFHAWRYGIPYAILPHGVLRPWCMRHGRRWLKRISFSIIERRCLGGAAFVHCTSEQEASELRALGITRPQVVIPLGIDLTSIDGCPPGNDFFQRQPFQLQGRFVFLMLGRLDPVKGLDLLLDAFAQVRRQRADVALVLAGDGDAAFVASLQHEVARLGLERDVVFTGFLTGVAKLRALVGADAFVLPSYCESFGIAVVEALACNKPVIVSDQVAIHRELTEAQAGLVVPCQAEPLAQAMATLATDAERTRWMGCNGRRLVEAHFSLEIVAATLAQAYADVLSHSGPLPALPLASRGSNHGAQTY